MKKNQQVRRSLRTLGAVAALSLALAAVPMMGGCTNEGTGDAGTTDASTAGEQGTVDISAAAGGTAATEGSTFSLSDGIGENGYWEGVTALDLVTLPAYDAIEVPLSAVTPTDEAVQEQVDNLVSAYTQTVEVTDRAIADGDTVSIDYVGSIDGVEFEGGSTGGAGTLVTIGVTQYIDDFLEQLIGHEPGESFDIEVTFPEDYGNEELNGKDAVFAITVNYIQETVVPEVTDEWVAETLGETYGWTTVAEMEESFAAMLQEEAVLTYAQQYVLDNSTVSELPQALVEYQENYLTMSYQEYATMFGISLDEMIQMATGYEDIDALIEANRAAIEQVVAGELVFQAIAEDQGIEIEDGEVGVFFEQAVGVSDYSGYVATYGMPYLKMCVLTEDVIQLLADNAVVVDDTAEGEDEAEAQDEASEAEETGETEADEQDEGESSEADAESDEQAEEASK